MRIEFDGEAGETFHRFIRELAGLTGEVVTKDGETFACKIIEAETLDAGYYGTAWVNRLDENYNLTGEPFTVAVESFRVF